MLQHKKLVNLTEVRTADKLRLVKVALAAMLVVAIGVGGWLAWQNYNQQQARLANQKNIIRARRDNVDIRITATGTIRPFNQVKLSPKYTGLLKALYVQQGDRVKAGQVVALMDDSNLLGQVKAARAAYEAAKAAYEKVVAGNRQQEIADAEAQLRHADAAVRAANMAVNHIKADLTSVKAQLLRDETNAKRLQSLKTQGAISDQDGLNATTQAEMTRAQLERTQQDLKQAEASLALAKADYESARQKYSLAKEGFRKEDIKAAQQAMLQARGNLEYIESQLADTKIKAPFDGIITQKYADPGSIVAPTTASMTNSATSSSILSLAGRLEMVAAVAETDIDNIRVGQPVRITAGAYSTHVFHGRVSLIAPEAIVNQNVTSFEVHTSIDDDPEHLLMSGMNVNAEFIAGKRDNVVLIPTVCVVTRKGKTGVFTPDSNGAPKFQPISIGSTSDSDIIVTSGLDAGDQVFEALTKEQLLEQGYTEKNILTPQGTGTGGAPRALRNKL
jgi:HlyD family secretion protein